MRVDPMKVQLPPKRLAIFRMVAEAGSDGVSEEELDREICTGQGKSTVRSAIHYINKAIFPLKIDGRKGIGYRLVREEKRKRLARR